LKVEKIFSGKIEAINHLPSNLRDGNVTENSSELVQIFQNLKVPESSKVKDVAKQTSAPQSLQKTPALKTTLGKRKHRCI